MVLGLTITCPKQLIPYKHRAYIRRAATLSCQRNSNLCLIQRIFNMLKHRVSALVPGMHRGPAFHIRALVQRLSQNACLMLALWSPFQRVVVLRSLTCPKRRWDFVYGDSCQRVVSKCSIFFNQFRVVAALLVLGVILCLNHAGFGSEIDQVKIFYITPHNHFLRKSVAVATLVLLLLRFFSIIFKENNFLAVTKRSTNSSEVHVSLLCEQIAPSHSTTINRLWCLSCGFGVLRLESKLRSCKQLFRYKLSSLHTNVCLRNLAKKKKTVHKERTIDWYHILYVFTLWDLYLGNRHCNV